MAHRQGEVRLFPPGSENTARVQEGSPGTWESRVLSRETNLAGGSQGQSSGPSVGVGRKGETNADAAHGYRRAKATKQGGRETGRRSAS